MNMKNILTTLTTACQSFGGEKSTRKSCKKPIQRLDKQRKVVIIRSMRGRERWPAAKGLK
jgi:hypothetical protein